MQKATKNLTRRERRDVHLFLRPLFEALLHNDTTRSDAMNFIRQQRRNLVRLFTIFPHEFLLFVLWLSQTESFHSCSTFHYSIQPLSITSIRPYSDESENGSEGSGSRNGDQSDNGNLDGNGVENNDDENGNTKDKGVEERGKKLAASNEREKVGKVKQNNNKSHQASLSCQSSSFKSSVVFKAFFKSRLIILKIISTIFREARQPSTERLPDASGQIATKTTIPLMTGVQQKKAEQRDAK